MPSLGGGLRFFEAITALRPWQPKAAPHLGSQSEQVLCFLKLPDYLLVFCFTIPEEELLEEDALFLSDEVLIGHDGDQEEALGQSVFQLLKPCEPF